MITFSAVWLSIGLVWLVVIYLLSHYNRIYLASLLFIILVIVVLAHALYLVPSYTAPLLSLAIIPVALALTLLGPRSAYIITACSILMMYGAMTLAHWLPSDLQFDVPLPSEAIVIACYALSLCLLLMSVLPLHSDVQRLKRTIQQGELSRFLSQQQIQDLQKEREQIQQLVQWQQHHTDMVLQQMGDGILATNAQGRIVRANAAAHRLWSSLFDSELLECSIKQVVTAVQAHSNAKEPIKIIVINDNDAPPSGVLGYTHILIDQREQARYQRLRDELFSLLNVEMRNPLTSMVTALEMTLGQNLPDGADRVLVGARRSGQRILELVNTMIEIDEIERNASNIQRMPALLWPVLEESIALTAPLSQQVAVTVVLENIDDGMVLQDKQRMRRTFVYLLEMALRNSPPYSNLQVRIDRVKQSLVVRISDQGAGLTTEQRASFFDQSVLLDSRSGSPLGLTFCKLLVESHGGQIWVESTEGQGTTYVISLPIAK